MSANDDDYYSDDDDEAAPAGDGGEAGAAAAEKTDFRSWLTARRGWLMIIGLTVAQTLFTLIMVMMRSGARPVSEMGTAEIQALAVDMLGHEVGIGQIYQLIPGRGGRRLTVGLDLVLVLGQLPEEQVAGAPRPTPEEMELFITAIRDMEPRIRSQVNILLQRIPAADYGTPNAQATIKEEVKKSVNDALEGLNFGKALRPEIGKRRVTEVLLPMLVRQYM